MLDWPVALGQKVRALRQARGLTQEQLAHDVGIDLTYLGGIERGRRNPSLRVIVRMAQALGVTPPELLTRSDRIA